MKGDTTLLTISGEEVTPSAVSDAEIEATLPAPLQAGPQGLQVVHKRLMGTPEQPHPGIESNVVAFVLTPQITKTGGNYNVTKGAVTTETINGQTVHSVDVTVKVKPTVGKDQRVLLVLNQLTATDPHAYSFPVNPLTADTATLVFRVKRARPGTYLVRVQVDGAESSLDLVGDTYSKPDLVLP
jgi:S-formylglutathione hydrolase FrmB